MTHLFIINPAAGSRDRTKYYRQIIKEICTQKGVDYEIKVSEAPGHCQKLAREAALTGKEYKIYACGGDGTLNEVAAGAAGFDNVAVTVFSGGSGNDFTKLFSSPEDFRDLERLLDSEEVTFDMIRCNDDLALNICSVGLDARIGTDVSNYKRLPLLSGFRAYAVSTLFNVIKGIAEHYVV
jgi:diacylglycerol kinase family enzyme